MQDFVVSVSELLRVGGSEGKLSIDGRLPAMVKAGEAVRFLSPVHLDIALRNVGGSILVKGRIEADVELTCSRCLKTYTEHLSTDVSEIFRKPEEFERAGMEALSDEKVLSILNDEIDLTFMVEQAGLLALPIKPLCDKTCKGLCPTCGEDLNIRPHEHEPEKDERLAPLKKLLEKNKET